MPRYWYIKTRNGKSGPVNCRRLLRLASDGKIFPNTGISSDGVTWIKAKRIKELAFPNLQADEWFIKTRSGKAGPYSLETLQDLADKGLLQPNTAVRSDGRKWLKAKRVTDLSFPTTDAPGDESLDQPPDRDGPTDSADSAPSADPPIPDVIPTTWAGPKEEEFARRFGPATFIDRDDKQSGPSGNAIDVCLHSPSNNRPFTTLVTSGMSDRAMSVPPSVYSPRVELVLYVDQMHRAYIDLLRSLAQVPFRDQTWIGYGSTLTNGSPPQPIFAGSVLDAYVFMIPNVESDFLIHESMTIEDSPLQLLWVVPITMAERNVILNQGMRDFCALCDAAQLSLLIEPNRRCALEAFRRNVGFQSVTV